MLVPAVPKRQVHTNWIVQDRYVYFFFSRWQQKGVMKKGVGREEDDSCLWGKIVVSESSPPSPHLH